jgi:hypothetical protein
MYRWLTRSSRSGTFRIWAARAERDTHAHDGIRVIAADDLGDHIALLGAQPGAFGRPGDGG